MYYNSSQTFGLHCPDRDIGLQTFDSEEALRLVHHFLPQTLSTTPSICRSAHHSPPRSACYCVVTNLFPACSPSSLHRRCCLVASPPFSTTGLRHWETRPISPKLPSLYGHVTTYLLLLLCSALLLRFDVPPLQLCTKYPKQQHTAPPEGQTIANYRPQAHRTTSPHQRAISYLRALGTSSLV
ncbi:uncharacterized protein CCOS01_05030 [Colletotrichum costaricense]|uniref:Uncharacterized protein n=1 Tax=Colletotrichum costaricense TaxID=1209916 RepID=A0AAI9Z3R9_9PEZI|nr:uncharacterized protein CCOS01_05030 [Colletotrichum costaricense]KAK1533047.1 hypothetical protein CCOS01_05030 [Colletotrichum costaricense]